MKTQIQIRDHVLGIPFWIGAALLSLGIFGLCWHFLAPTTQLDKIFPADSVVFAEVSLQKDSLEKLKKAVPNANFEALVAESLLQYFPELGKANFSDWIGNRAGLAILPSGDVLVAVRYRSESRAQEFLQNFILPGEGFDTSEVDSGELWIPKYSSQSAFAFYRGWLIFSTSQNSLREMLASSQNLSSSTRFSQIRSDLPKDAMAVGFINTEKAVDLFLKSEKYAPKRPLLQSLSQTLSAFGVAVEPNAKGIKVYTKMLVENSALIGQQIRRNPDQVMPELASYVPQDAMFFMNGSDLYAKYLSTKEFLAKFHPQFSVIFDGVLRSEFQKMFGEQFDFERDFLSKMRDQYAVVLNQKPGDKDEAPSLYFTLITGFGSTNRDKSLSDLHDAVRFAQGRFATKTEEVELPDGTTREELVATSPEEVPIQKVQIKNLEYYTAENPISSAKISYGFIDDNLVFSMHEEGVKDVFTTHFSQAQSLGQNKDFRNSVLFEYSPSESYGFMNFEKLVPVLENIEESTESSEKADKESWGTFLTKNFRAATFARKVFPNEIFCTLLFLAR